MIWDFLVIDSSLLEIPDSFLSRKKLSRDVSSFLVPTIGTLLIVKQRSETEGTPSLLSYMIATLLRCCTMTLRGGELVEFNDTVAFLLQVR